MTQKKIYEWFGNNNTIITKPKLFKKYFYLIWNDYNDYDVTWCDTKPINFNYEKKVNLKGYNEEIVLLGNIIYSKETVSLISSKDNFTTNNISFLKSHLQKCIRLGLIDKSIITAYLLMENNMIEFLRRLPIIILEDVHIIQDIDIIVWFMIMSDIITIPESFKKWCLYLIKYLCKCTKKNFYDKSLENVNYNNLNNLKDRDKSTIYSLMIRKSYGGMKGDILMINFLIEHWIKNLNNDFILEKINPKNITILNSLHPDLYELSAVDFHCYTKILDILHNHYPQYDIETIKNTIWIKSSSINYRTSNTNTNEILNECWNTIKYKLFRIQKKFIINNIKK